MQLSLLPIGRGVAESRVEAGRLDAHPVKRFRTTVGYVAIALLGTEEERVAVRREVDRSHRPVHSMASDPVLSGAFDPDLQLWVAACLYRGVGSCHATSWEGRPTGRGLEAISATARLGHHAAGDRRDVAP